MRLHDAYTDPDDHASVCRGWSFNWFFRQSLVMGTRIHFDGLANGGPKRRSALEKHSSSMKESRRSLRELVGLKKKKPVEEPPPPDAWLWEAAGSFASTLGFTSSSIAAGSVAAKIVTAAAATSATGAGTGAVAGSSTAALATLQTIGVATFTTPVGLCLVSTCVVVGGSVLLGKAFLFKETSKVSEDAWIMVEANEKAHESKHASERFAIAVFDDQKAAKKAYKHSKMRSKALFGPRRTLVLSRGWQERFREVVAAM